MSKHDHVYDMTDGDAIKALADRGVHPNVYGMYSVYVGGTFLAFDSPHEALWAILEDEDE